VIIYNSLSFKLAKDDAAQAAVVQFATTDGEQVAMVMSGEGLEQLARTILTVLEQHPEMRDWKSAQQQ
jgi:ABC-type microcin C transport system duplicated ATPase subunit YejF